MNAQAIAEILINHGVKPSFPRIQIYKYLYNRKNHPTVENIYNELISEIPTLSKTTVYNTLNHLVEARLVNALYFDENEKRYEIIIDDHSHFKCTVCNRIYDIPYGDINVLPEKYKDFKIVEQYIFVKGVCKDCIEK